MRDREEIIKETTKYPAVATVEERQREAMIELLLDIRDLLKSGK